MSKNWIRVDPANVHFKCFIGLSVVYIKLHISRNEYVILSIQDKKETSPNGMSAALWVVCFSCSHCGNFCPIGQVRPCGFPTTCGLFHYKTKALYHDMIYTIIHPKRIRV